MVPTECQRMGARSGKISRFLLSSISAVSLCLVVQGVCGGWVGGWVMMGQPLFHFFHPQPTTPIQTYLVGFRELHHQRGQFLVPAATQDASAWLGRGHADCHCSCCWMGVWINEKIGMEMLLHARTTDKRGRPPTTDPTPTPNPHPHAPPPSPPNALFMPSILVVSCAVVVVASFFVGGGCPVMFERGERCVVASVDALLAPQRPRGFGLHCLSRGDVCEGGKGDG